MFGKEMKERMKWGHWLEGKESEQVSYQASKDFLSGHDSHNVCVCQGGRWMDEAVRDAGGAL